MCMLQKLNYENNQFSWNSINFNVVCHTGCCGYMHAVTMTLCKKN